MQAPPGMVTAVAEIGHDSSASPSRTGWVPLTIDTAMIETDHMLATP
jgi:hypothetical protein